ncbi:craniofacial development protein 1 [Scaptodrosophila lebanonensis]|uniref:Craniofacial development protein 1 n=1 Tax=Drosophila lebanonensis TaxID=7225 RepID=A0A6J2UFE6_DROLE|nr:craniofacial development protein 1 [Scaptodrosophila lebanonensis]
MNKEENYASDSDQSDEDFCLENDADSCSSSGSAEDSEDAGSDADSIENTKTTKGSKKAKASSKKEASQNSRTTRLKEAQQNDGKCSKEKDELESDEDVDKSRSDALWADFLCDVGSAKAESPVSLKAKEAKDSVNQTQAGSTAKVDTLVTRQITEVLDFAGEQVTVQKTVSKENQKQSLQEPNATPSPKPAPPTRSFGIAKRPANGNAGGLGSLLNQLGKKKKMSVLEKSQLDWKDFKSGEGIDEELQTHNKGKDGYLERQDFLQRTDLRQFEIEKNLRQSTRRQN